MAILATKLEIEDEDCRLIATANGKLQWDLALAPGVKSDDHGQANNKTLRVLALAPGVKPDDHDQANNKKRWSLAQAPGVKPDDHGTWGLAEEEKMEMMIPTYPNHQCAPRDNKEESLLDYNCYMVPGGAFRIRGNDDDNDATFLTDS
jgi:hypothetical protein